VREWEYRKVALNEGPRKADDVDLLCDAGNEGWELVAILANSVAYFKREVTGGILERPGADRKEMPQPEAPAEDGVLATVTRGTEVKPKYRDPATGETWSGRGRMATWLKRKQDAGEDIADYLVE
jgi:hypothetical protein